VRPGRWAFVPAALAALTAAAATFTAAGGPAGAGSAQSPPAAASRARRLPVVRLGPDRLELPYDEPYAREKRVLLRKINQERAEAGLGRLGYSPRAARAGDLFCREAAERSFSGHWDLEGRAPYLRWAEAGGVDEHAENAASESHSPPPITDPPLDLLLRSHARMMAERPPDDGHRRTVLNPEWTHVGIGLAVVAGEFRMTEEYVRQMLDWVEIPAGALPAGSVAPFAAKLPAGWNVAVVEIRYEEPPRPLSRLEAGARRSYGLPPAIRSILPVAGPGLVWESGDKGSFPVGASGEFRLDVPLDRGPGDYYVVVFPSRGIGGKGLTPCTAARIRAK